MHVHKLRTSCSSPSPGARSVFPLRTECHPERAGCLHASSIRGQQVFARSRCRWPGCCNAVGAVGDASSGWKRCAVRPTFRPASVLLLQRDVVVAAYLLCAAIVPCWSCSKCMHNQFLTVIPDDSNLTIDSVTVHSAELESDAGPVRPVRLAAASTYLLLVAAAPIAGWSRSA